MKVTATLRKVKSKEKITGVIYVRVFEKNIIDIRMATNITVHPEYWDSRKQCISELTPESVINPATRIIINEKISQSLSELNSRLPKRGADNEWMKEQLTNLGLRGDLKIKEMTIT